jgi:hypothetical protein
MTPRVITLVAFIDGTNNFLPLSFLQDLYRMFLISPPTSGAHCTPLHAIRTPLSAPPPPPTGVPHSTLMEMQDEIIALPTSNYN